QGRLWTQRRPLSLVGGALAVSQGAICWPRLMPPLQSPISTPAAAVAAAGSHSRRHPMRYLRWLLTLALLAGLGAAAGAADPVKPKRLLMVTHSAGFMHDSIRVAEEVVKEIGPKNGFEVTCYRYTADPDAKVKVEKTENGEKVVVE